MILNQWPCSSRHLLEAIKTTPKTPNAANENTINGIEN